LSLQQFCSPIVFAAVLQSYCLCSSFAVLLSLQLRTWSFTFAKCTFICSYNKQRQLSLLRGILNLV